MNHPHDLRAGVPALIDRDLVRRLSVIEPHRALSAIVGEWLTIAIAIAAAIAADQWAVTLAAIIVVGARQHALLVIAHDASHYRLLPNRWWNDFAGNVLLAWPMFVTVQGFRHFHGDHHRFLQGEGDGNRSLWGTHDGDGRLVAEWTYPKSRAALAGVLIRRVAIGTGLYWIVRGLLGGFGFGAPRLDRVLRVVAWGAVLTAIAAFDLWTAFALYWVVPYCTWHVVVQYVRLICEHSAVRSTDPRYASTRSTIPGRLGRLLVLPRNIGCHQAHHWYPSVPFYRLPELHACLSAHPEFRAHASWSNSILASLADVTRSAAQRPLDPRDHRLG